MLSFIFFFFNDTATTEIYTLSLHDALPIFSRRSRREISLWKTGDKHKERKEEQKERKADRKSTRLNSSHSQISYAVFCLKKKKRPLLMVRHLALHHTQLIQREERNEMGRGP